MGKIFYLLLLFNNMFTLFLMLNCISSLVTAYCMLSWSILVLFPFMKAERMSFALNICIQ